MSTMKELQQEIEKAEQVLQESMRNLEEKPDDYSAQLLVLSMENHIGDLRKQLDILKSGE